MEKLKNLTFLPRDMYFEPHKLKSRDELEEILRRNDVESMYTGVNTIRNLLNKMKIDLGESKVYSKFTLTMCPVGKLITDQPYICPNILSYIADPVWNDESNEFYETGQHFNILTIPSFVTPFNHRKYTFYGNSRANFMYHLTKHNPSTRIPVLVVDDYRAEIYAGNRFETNPILKVIDLKIPPGQNITDEFIKGVYGIK